MPAVKTGMTPPPMPGMPAPMQPMGGVPPMQNPFAPMPPMPLAGAPQPPMPMPPMAQGQMPQGQQQQVMGSTAGRRRRFGDALEGMLGRNQGIGGAMPQQQRPMPMPQMMPQQRMVAPGTPMMRTPPMGRGVPRPMAMGGEVDIFGYEGGGPVQYYEDAGVVMKDIEYDAVAGNETLGNDMVMLTFADGTRRQTNKALYEAAKDLGALDNMQSGKDFADWHLNEWAAKVGSDPEYTAAHDKFNTNQIAYNQALMDEHPEIAKNRLAFTQKYAGNNPAAMAAAQELYDKYYGEKKDTGVDQTKNTGVDQTYGSGAGAGTAVDASGGMGTGVYEGSGYDQSGVTNFANFSGNIGRTLGGYPEGSQTPEMGALFGPNVGFAQRVSQYYTDPVTGGLATTYGPEMSSISPIGGILLPARPVDLDVFDFLSTPTYGTMYSGIDPLEYDDVKQMQMGGEVSGPFDGSVPRNTMIGDQPHMLAYINPQEADLLKDLGGTGEPGPGGIPAYRNLDADLGVGATNTGKTYSGSDKAVSGSLGPGGRSGHATDDDDKPSNSSNASYVSTTSSGATIIPRGATIARGTVLNSASDPVVNVNGTLYNQSNLPAGANDGNVTARVSGRSSGSGRNLDADLGIGMSSNTVTADQLSSGEGTTTYDTGDGGSVTVATGSSIDDILSSASSDDGGSSVMDVIDPVSVEPAPVYTDRRGNTYSSQAEADAADRAYAAQLASYGAGKVGFDRFKSDAASAFPGRPREDTDRMAARAYPDFVEDYSRDINIFDEAPFTYTSIPGIGGGPAGGSLGITPAPIVDSSVSPTEDVPGLLNKDVMGAFLKGQNVLEGQPVIGLDAPVQVDPDANDPRGNQIVSPTGTGIGLQSDLQRGLGDTGIIAARDADMDPFGTGTQVSLKDVKDRVARAEGTADEGGYGRLLGNQEGRFGVDLTDMTVQEVLDFQKQRGPGSYAEYSQGVNKQRGMTRADGSGVISTPAGKYQVVGATLEDLIDKGVVDPNAKFDEGTQEKIGSYLIAERRGLNDLQAGNITREQFEANLGKEFEGIKRGLDKGAGSTSTVIAAASEAGKQVEVDRRDENVEKIKKQIGDQAEPTGVEKFFYDVVGQLGLGLGKPLADKLRNASREDRQAIIDQHVYALKNGATPKTDEEGNYVGFDISTMDTFADKVLAAEDIGAFMPPSMAGGTFTVTQDMIDSLRASGLNAQADALTVGQKLNLPTTTNVSYQADADGDNVSDYDRFQQVYGAQSTAADKDPYGMSTEQGFITPDGKEFFVDASGNVVEITDGTVPFEPGGGEDVAAALGVTETTTGGDDDAATAGPDTGHVDGVCNTEGYVYNPETDMCEPPKEEDTGGDLGSPITTGITPRSFDDVLKSVVVPAPRIAPISENIRPMQGGGMVRLNRAADNFIKALAG